MTTRFKKLLARSSEVAALALPALAFAQAPTLPGAPITSLEELFGATGTFCTIFKWLFAILIAVAVIFILLAAYGYLTGGGDPEKVKVANKRILFAAIAVIVALLARVIPNLALSFIGAAPVGVQC